MSSESFLKSKYTESALVSWNTTLVTISKFSTSHNTLWRTFTVHGVFYISPLKIFCLYSIKRRCGRYYYIFKNGKSEATGFALVTELVNGRVLIFWLHLVYFFLITSQMRCLQGTQKQSFCNVFPLLLSKDNGSLIFTHWKKDEWIVKSQTLLKYNPYTKQITYLVYELQMCKSMAFSIATKLSDHHTI